ncbi:sulfite exporter TauE/SafE family protein [Rhizobium skierniewicense]|uniref:sulfite exporter TauE/SafE family protein n=1 Tax=Rhizobium skierniewicense TaxID=984260 RepID=UPI00157452B5|nr:sulfite exporter TauE/SafE family protein [Rhizobium skierniewicense]NTF32838.1 sulfite exporter TauE/SafE family protein [Rhizobium skierniewicense]
MLTDFHFFLVAIPAVTLVGLSKGGLGGALALMGVPLMALAVPPVQAAAIFLPILIVMDIVALMVWRHYNHRQTLLIMLPGAIAGITLGWAMSSMISPDTMRLMVASVTIIFVARYFVEAYGTARGGREIQPKGQNPIKATIWSSLSGYASFVAHAGGPPFQIYVLPLKLDPKVYTGMSVRFFAIMNAIKLIPYFALGALDANNLTTSTILLPVAMAATFAGAKIVKYMKPAIFYPLMYSMAFLAALKLLWDGLPF